MKLVVLVLILLFGGISGDVTGKGKPRWDSAPAPLIDFMNSDEARSTVLICVYNSTSDSLLSAVGFGTIVASDYILTTSSLWNQVSGIGEFGVLHSEFFQQFEEVRPHDEADISSWNDIALIQLPTPLPRSEKIRITPISAREKTDKLTSLEISSNLTSSAKVVLLDQSKCDELFSDVHGREYNKTTQICSEPFEGFPTLPLLADCAGRPVVTGILAYKSKTVSVFTKINQFCDWLSENSENSVKCHK